MPRNLKRIINYQKLIDKAVDKALELPVEPLIYSIKEYAGNRKLSYQFFRNKQFRSMIKSQFLSYYRTNTPVVLLIKFYVSPPSYKPIPDKQLKSEKVPAVHSHELCDYLLSFLEMIFKVLVNSYRQFVKIDMEKYYSARPRTVFKFMSYNNYVRIYKRKDLEAYDQGKPKSKSIGKTGKGKVLLPLNDTDECSKKLCTDAT